jgi:excisionase family DNA binding protein
VVDGPAHAERRGSVCEFPHTKTIAVPTAVGLDDSSDGHGVLATRASDAAPVPRLLLTPEEAARSLRIGRSLVYELMRSGRLQSVRIGACRRVPVDSVAEFVSQLRSANSLTVQAATKVVT